MDAKPRIMKKNGEAHIMMATPWRVRECRRKQARDNDKRLLAQQSDYIMQLKWELHEWETWYRTWVTGSDEIEGHDSEASIDKVLKTISPTYESGNPPMQLGISSMSSQCIDYSRWEHLSCYSSECAGEEDVESSSAGSMSQQDTDEHTYYVDYLDEQLDEQR